MTLKRYRARVKLATVSTEIVIEAESFLAAREQLETLYGKDAIIWGPVEA